MDLAYVAQTLEPVLGNIDLTVPSWLQPLDDFIQAANGCHSLNELLTSGILEKGRKLKISAGENYFEPIAMVAFTRFSFLMRRVFFRLMHHDLNTILDGLRELEARGVTTLDCRSAQFSADEPVSPAAHDLPVLEGDVPRRVLFRQPAADAGGSAQRNGRGSGTHQQESGNPDGTPRRRTAAPRRRQPGRSSPRRIPMPPSSKSTALPSGTKSRPTLKQTPDTDDKV